MQRVLQVVNIMDRGGVETLLMNIYRKINRESIQFDFLTHPYDQDYLYEYESEILSMGGQIYKAPSFSQNLHDYQTYIKVFFRNHPEYTVVHAHNLDSASLVYMREAKKSGRYLIAHSHNTNDHGGILKRRMLQICMRVPDKLPNSRLAKELLRLVIVKYSTMVLILLGIMSMKSNIISRVRNYLWM